MSKFWNILVISAETSQMAAALPPCQLYSKQNAAQPSEPYKGSRCRTVAKALGLGFRRFRLIPLAH